TFVVYKNNRRAITVSSSDNESDYWGLAEQFYEQVGTVRATYLPAFRTLLEPADRLNLDEAETRIGGSSEFEGLRHTEFRKLRILAQASQMRPTDAARYSRLATSTARK